jgi:hypothetical protein
MDLAIDTNHWIDEKLTAPAVEEIFRACGYHTEKSGEAGGFMTTWAASVTHPKP